MIIENIFETRKLRPIFFEFFLGSEVANFIQTGKGSTLLLDRNGFVYKRSQYYKTKLYWSCRDKDKKHCNARAITDQNNYIDAWKGVHNHPPNLNNCDIILS